MWVKSWHTPFRVLEAGLDRRVHRRALADVIEGLVDADVDIADERERIAAVGAVDAKLPRQIIEQRRGAGEVARHQHRPEVALARSSRSSIAPRIARQRIRQRKRRIEVDQRVGHDRQLAMMLRQVEVMDLVAEVILEREDARARVHRQPEREAALAVGR